MTEITAEMIREMESHLPYSITSKVKQWEWKADFLNRAVKHPDAPCPCCGVTPNGDILDHLTPEQWAALQPNDKLSGAAAADTNPDQATKRRLSELLDRPHNE